MSDFKTRLDAEKAELDERIQKLDDFLKSENFSKIDPVQMTLLNCQIHAMRTYSQILLERIARLPKPPEPEPQDVPEPSIAPN